MLLLSIVARRPARTAEQPTRRRHAWARRGATVLALTTALATTLALVAVSSASAGERVAADGAAPAPVRVMLAGDSLTNQFSGDYTWRWRLWQEFQRQGVPVDFVGPFRSLHGRYPQHYLSPWPDEDHAGIGGTWVKERRSTIGAWVTTYQPDYLMVELGTNDLHWGTSAEQSFAWMQEYLEDAHAAKPDMTIAVADVLSAMSYPTTAPLYPGGWASTNLAYNALVRQFIASKADDPTWKIVHIATQTAQWRPRTMTTDGVHPKPNGEIYLAQKYAGTLHDLGVLPQAPQVPRVDVVWRPNPVAQIRVSGRRVTFSWPVALQASYMLSGTVYVYRTGWRVPRSRVTGLRGDRVSMTLPPGRYQVRLRPQRKWMVGALGPQRSFRVR